MQNSLDAQFFGFSIVRAEKYAKIERILQEMPDLHGIKYMLTQVGGLQWVKEAIVTLSVGLKKIKSGGFT